MAAGPGDSGSPVLDCRGNVVGIVTNAAGGKAEVFPLKLIAGTLHDITRIVTIPQPTNDELRNLPDCDEPQAPLRGGHRITEEVKGTVTVHRVSTSDRESSSSTKPLENEVEVAATIPDEQYDGGVRGPAIVKTDGTWSISPFPFAEGDVNVVFTASAHHQSQGDKPLATDLIDSVVNIPAPSMVDTPINLEIYERGAHVANQVKKARSLTAQLKNDRNLPLCLRTILHSNQTNYNYSRSCSGNLPQWPQDVKTLIQDIDAAWEVAFSETEDNNFRTQLAANWMTSRDVLGETCGVAQVVWELLLAKFTDPTVVQSFVLRGMEAASACTEGRPDPAEENARNYLVNTGESMNDTRMRLLGEFRRAGLVTPARLSDPIFKAKLVRIYRSVVDGFGGTDVDIANHLTGDAIAYPEVAVFWSEYVRPWYGRTEQLDGSSNSLVSVIGALHKLADTSGNIG
jgi:hypothetical protein